MLEKEEMFPLEKYYHEVVANREYKENEAPLFGISYVIVTDGRETRKDLLRIIVKSIMDQPVYLYNRPREVIIVGNLTVDVGTAVRYIPMVAETKDGWVTRLMNRGCEAAAFPLVMMLHDDVVLSEDFWFSLLNNPGEWDFLAPKYLKSSKVFRGIPLRSASPEDSRWTILGPKGHRKLQDNEEWDQYSYVSGESLIMWKYAFKKVRWDETNNHKQTRGSSNAFDVQFGHKANRLGLKTDFDPSVRMYCLEP